MNNFATSALSARSARAGVLALVVATLACVGCGAPSRGLTLTFPDNRSADLQLVLDRLQHADAEADRAVVVALSRDGTHLSAHDLAGTALFNADVQDPSTAPMLAGDLVFLQEGPAVVARSLATGDTVLRRDTQQLRLVGAAGHGTQAVAVLSTGGAVGARSVVLFIRGGSIVDELAVDSAVGPPAMRGDLVLLPWGQQNLSAIEFGTGHELGRLRSLAGVLGHVRLLGDEIFFGQQSVGRWSPEVDGSAESEFAYELPEEGTLPGRAALWPDAYEPPLSPSNAHHRVRLAWAPTRGANGQVNMTDSTVYLLFYRVIFALSSSDLSVRWVHALEADVAGAEAVEGGLVIADRAGTLSFVSADGQRGWTRTLGGETGVATLRVGAGSTGSAEALERESLMDQLYAAAQDTDARLVPARSFAITALATAEGGDVTSRLVLLCEEPALPPELRAGACEALAQRQSGADVVLAGLARHANFLTDTTAPAVGALGSAAANMNEARGVPLLLGHLRDPHTSTPDLGLIAQSLGRLGNPEASEALKDFLWLYRAESDDPILAAALLEVARAWITLAGPPGREGVAEIAQTPLTMPRLRGLLGQLLQEQAADAQAADAQAADAQAADGQATDEQATDLASSEP